MAESPEAVTRRADLLARLSEAETERDEARSAAANLLDETARLEMELGIARANAEECADFLDEARAEVERLQAYIQEMVRKAAVKSLDGYRELGMRAANAENERDEARAKYERQLEHNAKLGGMLEAVARERDAAHYLLRSVLDYLHEHRAVLRADFAADAERLNLVQRIDEHLDAGAGGKA